MPARFYLPDDLFKFLVLWYVLVSFLVLFVSFPGCPVIFFSPPLSAPMFPAFSHSIPLSPPSSLHCAGLLFPSSYPRYSPLSPLFRLVYFPKPYCPVSASPCPLLISMCLSCPSFPALGPSASQVLVPSVWLCSCVANKHLSCPWSCMCVSISHLQHVTSLRAPGSQARNDRNDAPFLRHSK